MYETGHAPDSQKLKDLGIAVRGDSEYCMAPDTTVWAFPCAGAFKNEWIRAPPYVVASGTSVIVKASLTLCMEIVFPGGGGSGRSPFESAAPGEGLRIGIRRVGS